MIESFICCILIYKPIEKKVKKKWPWLENHGQTLLFFWKYVLMHG